MKIERFCEVLGNWSSHPGTLHERLTASIKEAIRQGNFLPGTRLPAERALAQALAVSRTTVLTSYNQLRSAGWLASRTGSGTWVSREAASAARARTHTGVIARSPLLNLLLSKEPGAIDFAVATTGPLVGAPPEWLDLSREQMASLLAERSYLPFGLPMLRDSIARHYSRQGIPTTVDEVLVTTGSQQAISLICALFVQRGDPVLVENPTYFGALDVFRFAGARLAPLQVSADHVRPQALRNRIASGAPRLIYLTPTFQNPTGVVMPEAARAEVARLAEEFGVPLIEDETLAYMSFASRRPRPIAAFAGAGTVLTISSLSKLFCPGIRVGWIRGPAHVIARLARIKSAVDLGSPLLTQAIGAQLFCVMDEAMRLRREELLPRKELLRAQLRASFPDWEFADVQGGLSLWVRLPGADARTLAQIAIRRQLAIAPGSLFSVDDSFSDYLRIPFLLEPELIVAGIERLAESWQELARPSVHTELMSSAAMV